MLIYMNHFLTMPPAPFHLESYSRAKEERLLEVWPRGYGKSVTWSICYPLWVALCNPYGIDRQRHKEEMMLVSNTGSLCEKWIRAHKLELTENEGIKSDFGPEQGEVWRVDEYELSQGGRPVFRVFSKSAGSQTRGEHPHEVVIDDLENREEAAGDGTRAKMRAYFYQDLWGTLRHTGKDKTRVKIVGTFVHPLALLPELFAKDWWIKRKYSVYDDKNAPLWPEYMGHDALDELRSQVTPTAWASEYLNEPIVSENPVFIQNHIKEYRTDSDKFKSVEKEGLYSIVALDPAISRKDTADYSALVTISATFDAEPKFYVRQGGVVRGRWPLDHSVTELARLYQQYNCGGAVIETVAMQQAVADEFKRYSDRNRFYARIVEIKPDKDKERRAHAIIPLLQRGEVYFDVGDPMVRRLVDEMLVFPTGKHDDLVDAFVYALTELKKWVKRERWAQDGPHIVLNGERDQLTGIIA